VGERGVIRLRQVCGHFLFRNALVHAGAIALRWAPGDGVFEKGAWLAEGFLCFNETENGYNSLRRQRGRRVD